jgi:GMP synthase PP-ATPase subunit
MARVERRQQIAIRRLSLRRGVIARDLIKSIKAKETSAVRIQRVARGSIVRNQVQTDNTAATRIQSNHRGHVVRKRQNMDKQKVQKVQQDQASDESESFFDKFFLVSCCTGWGTTKSIEADLSGTPKPITTDDPVTIEPACDEKYPAEGAVGLTGSRKSTFAKRGENSAIRIQSVVRGGIGREMARAERHKHFAIRLQSLRRGVIARDLIKSMNVKETSAVRIQCVARGRIARDLIKSMNAKETSAVRIQRVARGRIARDLIKSMNAKETSAVRIQRVARGRIVRNQVRTENTAATRIQSNHRGHVVRKRQNRDTRKVQQDQASDESESFFDKFFVMSCCTGWGTTKSVEADPFETPKTASTDGPVTTEPKQSSWACRSKTTKYGQAEGAKGAARSSFR